jgi:integrase
MGRRATGTVEPLKGSIRLKFTVHGTRCVEPVALAPTPANIKAAQRLLENVQRAIAAGVYRREDFFEGEASTRAPTTFSEYATDWLSGWVKAPSTKRTYKTAFDASWNPHFGTVRIDQLRQRHIRQAVAARAKEIQAHTLNNHLSPLRECLRAAVADKLIPDSPAEGIENLPSQKVEPDPFEVEEREAVLAHMRAKYDEQIWNYFVVAFHTGMRPSEQIALIWGDVDWKKRKLRVERARVDGEEKQSTKTNHKRYVDLSDVAIAALTRQKAHTFMKGAAIFENPNTRRPWNDVQLQRLNYFIPTLKALGLRHRDCYQTRHTFATTALMGNVNPAYISKQLGHTTMAMLFATYGRWLDGADGGAEAKKLNAALTAPPPELSTNCPRDESKV